MSPSPEQAQPLVPPRPNLGPEPWSGDGGAASLLLLPAIVALGLLAFWRRARRRGRRGLVSSPSPASPVDESPEARLLKLCEQLRGTLSARFGPELHARTTEEIAGDPAIRDLLGADLFQRMTEFLHTGDRLKFAGRDAVDGVVGQLEAYAAWASALEALPRRVNGSTRRSPGDRTERRSPRTRPRRSGA